MKTETSNQPSTGAPASAEARQTTTHHNPLRGQPFAVQLRALSPDAQPDDASMIAARGVAGASAPLPHIDVIQRSFGAHDVSGARSQVGGSARGASEQLGALAYATGDRVGFAAPPDLRTSAHEAAHLVQQRAGVDLPGNVGRAGDDYERQADAVADAVVAGRSAESLLGPAAGAGRGGADAVQRSEDPMLDEPPPSAPAPPTEEVAAEEEGVPTAPPADKRLSQLPSDVAAEQGAGEGAAPTEPKSAVGLGGVGGPIVFKLPGFKFNVGSLPAEGEPSLEVGYKLAPGQAPNADTTIEGGAVATGGTNEVGLEVKAKQQIERLVLGKGGPVINVSAEESAKVTNNGVEFGAGVALETALGKATIGLKPGIDVFTMDKGKPSFLCPYVEGSATLPVVQTTMPDGTALELSVTLKLKVKLNVGEALIRELAKRGVAWAARLIASSASSAGTGGASAAAIGAAVAEGALSLAFVGGAAMTIGGAIAAIMQADADLKFANAASDAADAYCQGVLSGLGLDGRGGGPAFANGVIEGTTRLDRMLQKLAADLPELAPEELRAAMIEYLQPRRNEIHQRVVASFHLEMRRAAYLKWRSDPATARRSRDIQMRQMLGLKVDDPALPPVWETEAETQAKFEENSKWLDEQGSAPRHDEFTFMPVPYMEAPAAKETSESAQKTRAYNLERRRAQLDAARSASLEAANVRANGGAASSSGAAKAKYNAAYAQHKLGDDAYARLRREAATPLGNDVEPLTVDAVLGHFEAAARLFGEGNAL